MPAIFDGRITLDNILSVGRVASGSIIVGEHVRGCGIPSDTMIKNQLSRNTYGLSAPTLTLPVGSATMESYAR